MHVLFFFLENVKNVKNKIARNDSQYCQPNNLLARRLDATLLDASRPRMSFFQQLLYFTGTIFLQFSFVTYSSSARHDFE